MSASSTGTQTPLLRHGKKMHGFTFRKNLISIFIIYLIKINCRINKISQLEQ